MRSNPKAKGKGGKGGIKLRLNREIERYPSESFSQLTLYFNKYNKEIKYQNIRLYFVSSKTFG